VELPAEAPWLYQKVKRQRSNCHHQTALDLVRACDVIYLEDLQVRNMSRRPAPVATPDGNGGDLKTGASAMSGLNTAIHDAGWYAFRRILVCKAACAGKRVEAIPPAYTSQDCSGCGERRHKSLSVRTHVCTPCGLMLARDENAA
jgi:putative transposase